MTSRCSIAISSRSDVEEARRQARAATRALGFSPADVESVVLAVSELGMNLLRYANEGIISISDLQGSARAGISVTSDDAGPGIADIGKALTDGFSTGGGLGLGLSGVQRLMDTFTIESDADGTHISAHKWLPGR